jgi:hypothetical protein
MKTLPPSEKKIWFPAKRYGWGWGPPVCWQGWAVLAVWLSLVVAGQVWLRRHPGWFAACLVGLVLGLIAVCYWKGEKPRWRWGKD